MPSVHSEQLFILIMLISIVFYSTERIERKFRPSDVELIPNIVILNSVSSADFFCINYQSNDFSLVIGLSKNISKDRINIVTKQLNETTVHIRMVCRNYIGIFHLICYSKDKQDQGTRADVIVKGVADMIQLINQCQVYNRKDIKCLFRAPTIARAIQNGFAPEFEFTEIPHSQPFYKNWQFLQNETTDEYLLFKWTPVIDENFPNSVLMTMKITLPFFGTSLYRFNMSPSFLIKPDFILRNLSSNKIELRLSSLPIPTICEKSIQSKRNANINRTWTDIELNQTSLIIDRLALNTTYQICVRCREISSNFYDNDDCQEITTSNKLSIYYILIIVIIVYLLILAALIVLIYFLSRKTPVVLNETDTKSVKSDSQKSISVNSVYSPVDGGDLLISRDTTYLPIDERNPFMLRQKSYSPIISEVNQEEKNMSMNYSDFMDITQEKISQFHSSSDDESVRK